ncbi:putative monocarboxylate transporter [Rhypophila decipiens]|uniref:Monocarboxylate transporter n=1 Tax=Rhypophila decipiens TaxID=261697 RepID=A0AAN6YJX0_9PEZI|nr:putative monocarboxylate transporter [Rhypophila decipiens]
MPSQEKQTSPSPSSLQVHIPSPIWSSSSSTLDLGLSTPHTPNLPSTFPTSSSTEKLSPHSTDTETDTESQNPKSDDDDPSESPAPEGGLHAWLTVVGSFCITTAVYGLSNSVGVIQPYWAQHQLASFSVHNIAWISGANIFLCLFLGVQFGPWFDRFGPRWLLAVGSLVYLAGLAGISLLPPEDSGIYSPGMLFGLLLLLWGVVMGTGAALCCTVAVSVLAHWFNRRRGLAAGVVFVGSSIGGAVFPLILRSTFGSIGWAWSMRIILLIVAVLLAIGNLLVRGRFKGRRGYGAIDFSLFRQWSFVWTTIGCFSEGSGVGRLTAGALSDKMGRFNTMIAITIFSIITTFAVWLLVDTYSMGLYYVFGAMFGFGTGCVISIGPICVGQLTVPGRFGQFYGTSYSVVSFS